jgi:hypothetical protein
MFCLVLNEICFLNEVISLVLVLKNFRFPGHLWLKLRMYLTFQSPAVTLRTTRFIVQKLYVLLTLLLFCMNSKTINTVTLPYTESTDCFHIIGLESVHFAVRNESLIKTGKVRL